MGSQNKVTILDLEYLASQEPTEEQVHEYAEFLDLDLQEYPDLKWIARHGVSAKVPHPWKACTENGRDVFYFNSETAESVWYHPCDEYYLQLAKTHKGIEDAEKYWRAAKPQKSREALKLAMAEEDRLISVRILGIDGEQKMLGSFSAVLPIMDCLVPQVAEAIGAPPVATRLLHGETLLEAKESLTAAGIVDSATLTSVVDSFILKAQTIFDKLVETEGTVAEMNKQTAKSFEAALNLSVGGAEELPADLRAFLTVMLHSGKVVKESVSDWDMNDARDLNDKSDSQRVKRMCVTGLFYLSCNEYWDGCSTIFVDLTGKFSEHPKFVELCQGAVRGSRGSVWLATFLDMYAMRNWKVADDVHLRCIASNVTELFRHFAETGFVKLRL